ncbi:MAG: prolyl oligopeptidase family serine peptidase [Chitinophagales bacterium]|nr:prolyl oligopeptidase family serine peptidase [Chitinophagales bacterium]
MFTLLRLYMLTLLICCNLLVLAQFNYPVARTEPFDTLIYGKKISDPYFWMSRKANEKEMLDFSKAQVSLTKNILDSIPGAETLLKEWDKAYASLQDELWNLKTVGTTIYYNRDIPGEGTWLCRRSSPVAPEEIILNKVIINGQRYSIRKKVFAHNKPLVALMLTQSGEANPQIRIFDMDKKEFLVDSIGRVMFNDSRGVSMTWMPDDNGLLYTQAPPTDISSEIYYNGKIKLHITGTDPLNDETIFGTNLNPSISLKDYETPYVYSFNNSPYIIARIRAGDADNYAFAVHYSKINGRQTPWKRLKNYINLGDGFDANGKYLYAGTKGKPRYEIVKINMETGESPEVFLPQQTDVIAVTDAGHSSGIIAGKKSLYVLLRRIGDMQVIKVDYKTKSVILLPLTNKGAVADMSLLGDDDLVFASGSAIKSVQYMHYDFQNRKLSPLPFAEKIFDASDTYSTKVIWVPSRDGKQIPVSLIYKRTLSLQNNNALLIDAYGNSGASNDLFCNPTLWPWLKRGGIYAYAHVRGGGELGDDWIKDGQFPNKMNSINDVVDVAAYFVKNAYTSSEKQLVMGGSAGSFLVGMSINQRPDLFAGGLFLSGLPDIVTYRDAAFARESKSVGPIDTKEGFFASYSISSYYQIPENKKLPAMLIAHGATDYILGIHPAARYTAKLQRMQKGNRPILFLVDWEAGHHGSDEEMLYMYKFAFWQTGHPDFQLK